MTKCVDCGWNISWSEQRRQFARASQKYGLTPDEAKKAMPRCQICTTNTLSPHVSGGSVSEPPEKTALALPAARPPSITVAFLIDF
jgi:hypothetical protein